MKTFVSPDDLANARTKSIKEQQQSELPSVANRLNAAISRFNTNRNSLFTDQSARVTEMNDPRYGYNPYQGYRSDSAEWKESVDKRTADIENDANTIRNILDEYEPYFDTEWVKNIREGLKSTSGSLSEITKFAQSTDEYSQNLNNIARLRSEDLEVREAASKKFVEQNQSEIDKAIANYNLGLKEYTNQHAKNIYESEEDASFGGQISDFNIGKKIGKYIADKSGISGNNALKRFGVTEVWSNESKLILYNLLNENRLEEATKFADEYNTQLEHNATAQFAKDKPVLGGLSSVSDSILGGIEWVDKALGNISQKAAYASLGLEAPKMQKAKLTERANALSKGVMDKWDWDLELAGHNIDVADLLYSTLTSGAESLALAFVPGGAIFLGASAASQASNDIIDRGGTNAQAILGGLSAGVFEALFEKITIGNLKSLKEVKPQTLKDILKNIAKSTGVNFTEEVATETANILYDSIINADISNYNNLVKQYLEENPNASEKDAKKYAAAELGIQIAQAGVSGALMGGAFGGAFSIVNYARRSSAIKSAFAKNPQQLISLANSMTNNAEAKRLADIASNELIEKGKLSQNTLNALYNVVEASDFQIIENAVANRLAQLGVSEYDMLANTISKKMQGVELTKQEQKLFDSSEYSKQILNELNPENNTKISDIPDWVKNIGTSVVNADIYNKNRATPTTTDALVEAAPNLANITAANPSADVIKDSIAKSSGVERLSEGQKTLRKIGQSFGARVEFADLDYTVTDENGNQKLVSPEGSYNRDTNTITLNTNVKDNHRPVLFVLKHELTHSLEKTGVEYEKFMAEVLVSDEYETYFKNRGFETADHWYQDIIDRYARDGKPLGDKNESALTAAKKEAVADFVGDKLFGGRDADIEELLKSLQPQTRKTFIEKIKEFFANLKARFKGRTELTEIEALEKRFLEVANKVSEINKAEEDGKAVDNKDNKAYSVNTDDNGGVGNGEEVFNQRRHNETRNGENRNQPGTEAESKDSWPEDKAEFIKRAGKYRRDGKQKVIIDTGKAVFAYLPAEADRSLSYKAVKYLRSLGIEAIYCDGGMESNFDGRTETHPEAVTGPDGRVYINKQSSLSAITLAIHEGTHHFAKKGSPEYKKFKSVIESNINISSETFVEIAFLINEKNFDSKYEIDDEAFYPEFIRELTAYTNQYITEDYDMAVEKFASLFTNWDAVVEASKKFNEDIGLAAVIKQSDTKFSLPETDSKAEYSLPPDATVEQVGEAYKNGEISQEEYIAEIDRLFTEKVETEGKIKRGEIVEPPNKRVPTPKSVSDGTKVRQFARTILESGYATPEMEAYLKELVLEGDFSYTPTSNEKTLEKAKKNIESQGYGNAKDNWQKAITQSNTGADAVATGEALLRLALENNDAVEVVNIAADLAEFGTRTAQSLQAFSLLKRMGGLGQLVYIQRTVNKLNEDLKKRFKKNTPTVSIDPKLADLLAKAETNGEYDVIYAKIMQDVAAQVPPTFLEKWNAWRYMSMLFNPTTHVRNLTGNGIFLPAVRMKDLVALGMEQFVAEDQRTKVLKVQKQYQRFAEKDFEEVKDIITGSGKYNPSDAVSEYRRIFKNKVLENARKLNFDLLEKEDIIFLKAHYRHALGSFLQAQKVDIDNISTAQLVKAREYAINEALKATYRDASKVANMMSQLSKTNRGANIILEGVLPFKKTPINIMKRGLDYSPIGLVKTLSKGIYDLKTEKITVSQFIDGLAAGTVGTGVFLIGVLLSALGVAKGGFDDDEEWFRKLNGEQEYSIEIGGKSYTIDWAAPSSIPFFMGVAISEYNADEDADILSMLYDFGMAGFEPIMSLSMLSGIEDVISSVSYAEEGQKLTTLVGSSVKSYFSQALPTIFGKVANVLDDTRRTSYIDKTSNIPEVVQQALDKIASKTPFASKTRAEYIDAWGETKYTGNFIQRFFQQFVSPGYASTVSVTDTSKEISRLYKVTGEAGVYPSTPKKYVKFREVRKDLSQEEYYNYATFKGQRQANMVDEAIHSKEYESLTDEQKAEVIKDIYNYASVLAKCQLDYTYDELSAMVGEDKDGNAILTKEKYNRLDDKARRLLVYEYFTESGSVVKAYKAEKNGKSVVEYFIKKIRKENK